MNSRKSGASIPASLAVREMDFNSNLRTRRAVILAATLFSCSVAALCLSVDIATQASDSRNGNSAASSHASGEGDTPVLDLKSPELFVWLKQPRPGLWGSLFFLFGAMGGLITAAFSIGEVLPGLGGGDVIEADQAKAAALEDRISNRLQALDILQSRIASSSTPVPSLEFVAGQQMRQIQDMQSELQRTEDRISSNRWSAWKIGMPIYVIVGGGTSLLLAKDVLQAILFGASWTSVVAAIGLKSTAAQKQNAARNAATDLTAKIDQLQQENTDLKNQSAALKLETNETAKLVAAALRRLMPSAAKPAPKE